MHKFKKHLHIYIHSALKMYYTPSFFSHFVMLLPYVKLLYITPPHINLHSIHHIDKEKTEL